MTTNTPTTASDDEEQPVAEDPNLEAQEKQVSIVSEKTTDLWRVHSEVASITRYLLNHPEFDEENRRVVDGSVVAVTGTIPIGLVDLKGKPRKSDQYSQVTSSAELQEREP